MDIETANYILTYFSSFMTDNEKVAQRHHHSTIKLSIDSDPNRVDISKKVGWLSDENDAVSMLDQGYESFVVKTASRIIEENGNEVFLNNCPICGKLARTPHACQCRQCGHDWHK